MMDEFDFTEEMATELPLIPTGEYEATIDKAEESILPSGTRVINLNFKIRDDVEQCCKNRFVSDTIWPDSEDPTKWDKLKMYQILHNGQDLNDKTTRLKFKDVDDLIQYLNGLNVRISVISFLSKKDGTNRNGISKRNGYMPTRAKPKTLGSASVDSESITVDSPLPF